MNWLLLAAETAEGEARGFSLNLNILETNLLNIFLVLGLLIYLGRGYLRRVLGERRAELENSIVAVEDRGREAEQQLVSARQNLSQAQAQAQQILAEARVNAERLRSQILDQAQGDIERVREGFEQDLQSEQQRMVAQVRLKIVGDALTRLQQRLPGDLNPDTQSRLLDKSIQLLN